MRTQNLVGMAGCTSQYGTKHCVMKYDIRVYFLCGFRLIFRLPLTKHSAINYYMGRIIIDILLFMKPKEPKMKRKSCLFMNTSIEITSTHTFT